MSTYFGTDIILFSFYVDGAALTAKRAELLGVNYVPDAVFNKTIDSKKTSCIHSRGITETASICFGYDDDVAKIVPKKLTKEHIDVLHMTSSRLIFPLNP